MYVGECALQAVSRIADVYPGDALVVLLKAINFTKLLLIFFSSSQKYHMGWGSAIWDPRKIYFGSRIRV